MKEAAKDTGIIIGKTLRRMIPIYIVNLFFFNSIIISYLRVIVETLFNLCASYFYGRVMYKEELKKYKYHPIRYLIRSSRNIKNKVQDLTLKLDVHQKEINELESSSEYQEMVKCDRDIEDILMLLDELEIILRKLNEREDISYALSTIDEEKMDNIMRRVRVIGK